MLSPEVLTIAPPALIPAPETCIVSARVTPPEIAIAAPLPTTVAPADTSLPSALFFCTCSVPAVIVVRPEYVFSDEPESVNVLAELVSLRSAPAPEITPENTWLVDERYCNRELVPSAMLPEYVAVPPESVPSEPSLVTSTLPPLLPTVMLPEKVLVPDSRKMPSPAFVSVPEPVVIASMVTVCVDVPSMSTVSAVSVPVIPAETVRLVPVSSCSSEAASINICDVSVGEPLVTRTAPTVASLTVTPAPRIVSGSSRVIVPAIASVAFVDKVPTVVPIPDALAPSALALEIETTPSSMAVVPV